jgi:hypothetical protein
MSEEFFVYHFNGGNGLAGAFSEAGETGEAGASTEYGYLVNDEEIPALEDHLVHKAEIERGVSPVRDVDGDTYQILRQSPEEAVSEVRSEFDVGRVKDYDLRNILRTPVEGYAPGQELAFGPNGEEELRKTARRGYVEGQRESFRNNRAKDNTTNRVDFYTNRFEEEELDELEEFIQDL